MTEGTMQTFPICNIYCFWLFAYDFFLFPDDLLKYAVIIKNVIIMEQYYYHQEPQTVATIIMLPLSLQKYNAIILTATTNH